MRDYPRYYAIRYALWRAYEMKCFYCGRPVDFMNLMVDHVLPQGLANNPRELATVLEDYEILNNFPGFSINSLSNLVASHGASCNLRKSNAVFPKRAALFYLCLVQEKLPRVIDELERLTSTAQRGEVLGGLGTLLERGDVSPREVLEILSDWQFRRTFDEPLIVTFGLNFGETLEMRGMAIATPPGYAIACDQFESELVDLLRSLTPYSFHYSEASARDGEILSVRLVFPELEIGNVDLLPLEEVCQRMLWWEVLEISNFYIVYGRTYTESIDS